MPIAQLMRREDDTRSGRTTQTSLGRPFIVAMLTLSLQTAAWASDCPPLREPRIPPIAGPVDPVDPVNINSNKKQLRAYKDGNYNEDIKLVLDDALAFIESRIDKVKQPAVVLDIDETSLSNWPNIDADDFGFMERGECPLKAKFPCGFAAWIERGLAPKIRPTLDFFNAVRARHIAVFFVTGRLESQREVTIRNLKRAGFRGWTGLKTLPDSDRGKPITPFKSRERANIEKEGYTIIANIGDQRSDLAGDAAGDHAECKFKVPNPFYFIP
jgi:predicted secreted acid phosphatase